MECVTKNGYKLYLKTRQTASSESFRRAKEILPKLLYVHPILSKCFHSLYRNTFRWIYIIIKYD
jgi:hypothetical protein